MLKHGSATAGFTEAPFGGAQPSLAKARKACGRSEVSPETWRVSLCEKSSSARRGRHAQRPKVGGACLGTSLWWLSQVKGARGERRAGRVGRKGRAYEEPQARGNEMGFS